MFDYNLLGRGYVYSDIRNVTSSLQGEAKLAFLDEYGEERISTDEIIADSVLVALHSLHVAYEREKFPWWAEEELSKLKNGELLANLLKWMER